MLNLDTNVFLAALEGRLRPAERELLEGDFWSLSPMVLWEMSYLWRKQRIGVGLGDPTLRRVLDQVTLWPVDLDVVEAIEKLDFESDPADQIIAATSLVHEIPLVTRDMTILESRVVPLALRG